jgi:hypothetical protein
LSAASIPKNASKKKNAFYAAHGIPAFAYSEV